MCLMPEVPEAKDPKLPRTPIQIGKPADFSPEENALFTSKGRSGQRGLRIKRTNTSIGGIGGSNAAAPLTIGAQVPV